MAIEKDKLYHAVTTSFDEFIAAFSSFEESEINTKPAPDKWSAVQVALHIILGTDGVPDHKTGSTDREADAMLVRIRPWWEDLNQKFEAPEALKPDDKLHSKDEIVTELKRVREKDLNMIQQADLSLLCLDFELPTIGYLTRYEWLWFIQMHLNRHTFQLHNMKR